MAKKEADSKVVKSKAAGKSEKSKRGGVKKYLRDLSSELKKVVWPSRKQVINNTGVVLTVMAIMALFLFGIDTGLGAAIRALLNLGA